MFTEYENKDSIITEEMMAVWQIENYEDIFYLYKNDPEFSNHISMKIVVKLYGLVEQLSSVSQNIRLFVKTQKQKISTFYRLAVDLDDAVKVNRGDQKVKLDLDLPEQLKIFMFILKITKKLEVSIKLPNMVKSVQK